MARIGVTCLGIALLLAACTGSEEPSNGPGGLPTPPATTPSPEASPEEDENDPDRYAIPDPITREYLDLVFTRLLATDAEVTRIVLEDPELVTSHELFSMPTEILTRLLAVHTGQKAASEAIRLFEFATDEELRSSVQETFVGQAFYHTLEILHSDESCVIVRANLDVTETAGEPPEALPDQWVVLVPNPEPERLAQLNPTPWKIATEQADIDDQQAPTIEECEQDDEPTPEDVDDAA